MECPSILARDGHGAGARGPGVDGIRHAVAADRNVRVVSAEGHACLADLAQGTVCKILGEDEVKPHKVRYYLERR